jgi:hypothetical protein
MSFYRCWTPAPVPLWRLIAVAQIRWRIEEDHQLAKQVVGLDSGQVIRWRSWHRWSALCLLAYIYLAVTTCRTAGIDPAPERAGNNDHPVPDEQLESRLIRATTRHDLARTFPRQPLGIDQLTAPGREHPPPGPAMDG